MKQHPIASIFPLMKEHELAELTADIEANGLIEPIVVCEDMILDGRNRQMACERARIEPRYQVFDGDDLVGFVISKNLHRRHMTTAQRAMAAARLAQLPAHRPPKMERQRGGLSQPEAAELLGTSVRSVQNANVVIRGAIPELLRRVEAGQVSLHTASLSAVLPMAEQQKLTEKGNRAIVAHARKFRAHRGFQGRSNHWLIWQHVDALCDALELSRLDSAEIAARKLLREIEQVARQPAGERFLADIGQQQDGKQA